MAGAAAGLSPVRGLGAGHQSGLLQLELLSQFNSATQVAKMYRVKGAPKNRLRAGSRRAVQRRTCPSPSTIYFFEVSPSKPTGPRA